MCGAPYESPRIVVAMILHEPDRSIAHYGGAVSARGAMKIVDRTLLYMQIPASPALPLPPPSVASLLWKLQPVRLSHGRPGRECLGPRLSWEGLWVVGCGLWVIGASRKWPRANDQLSSIQSKVTPPTHNPQPTSSQGLGPNDR